MTNPAPSAADVSVDVHAILREAEEQKQARANQLPTEQDCIRMMVQCRQRLMELGWRSGEYAPKDRIFEGVTAGFAGPSDCQWLGSGFFAASPGDWWPISRPLVFREKEELEPLRCDNCKKTIAEHYRLLQCFPEKSPSNLSQTEQHAALVKEDQPSLTPDPVSSQPTDDSHAFKNFHRNLCERFDYCHDETDWRRDQVSLLEHIAGLMPTTPSAHYLLGHQDGLNWAAAVAESSDPRTGDWLYDDRHDLAAALRKGPELPDQLPLSQPTGWQPIESAPKDGRQILLSNGVSVAQGWWEYEAPYVREQRDPAGVYLDQQERDGFDGWMDCDGGMLPEPTLWQPLPAASLAPKESTS